MPLSPGSILANRYRVEGLLGQGGMGAVYHAHDLNLDKPVALKENLHITSEGRRQFNREAQLLSNLTHPHLPRVTDYFSVTGQGDYLVMDFVEGQDLRQVLETQGALDEVQALRWIDQVAGALEYLHSQNPPIIHRDVKPNNIKIRPDGQAMLVDFGIAKTYDPTGSTTIGAKAVTPGYSPPEQYGQYGMGRTDPRADVYALGATLYAMVTGAPPADGIDRMTGQATLVPVQQQKPAVSARTTAAIGRAMELSPDRRFQRVTEFRQALQSAAPPAHMMATVFEPAPAPTPTAAVPQPVPPAVSRPPSTLVSRPPSQPLAPPARRGGLGWLFGSVGGLVVGGLVCIGLAVCGVLAFPLAFPQATPTPAPTATPEPTPTPARPYFGPITFASGLTSDNQAVNPGTTFAFGTTEIFAVFDYANVPPGADFKYQYYLDGSEDIGDEYNWKLNDAGRTWVSVSNQYGVLAGHYRLELHLDGAVLQSGEFDVPSLAGEFISYDGLKDSGSGFSTGHEDTFDADYDLSAEEFYIRVKNTNWIVATTKDTTYLDVMVEVVARLASGPRDTGFGVVCRYQSINDNYYFSIGKDGLYAIGKYVGGEATVLTGGGKYASSDAIASDQDFYVIDGKCVGNELSLYVNGKLVDTAYDSTHVSGEVGLIAETFENGAAEVRFDNFTLFEGR